MIRVAYFGLPLGALLLAADGTPPALVVLSPAEAPGRRRLRRTLSSTEILDSRDAKPAAFSRRIDAAIAACRPELIVSWYFSRRVEQRWLDAARLGAIGAHPSLLPRHRGPNPFFAAIDSGDVTTGVSVHALTLGYDEGDVLFTEEIPVGGRDAWQLARALDRPSLRLLRRAVKSLAAGTLPPRTPQNDALATWAAEPSGELLRADFRWSTERVLRRVRALAPVPGLALTIRGVELSVVRAEATERFPLALHPGEAHPGSDGVVIRTGDGAIAITRAAVVDETTNEVVEMKGAELADLLRPLPENA